MLVATGNSISSSKKYFRKLIEKFTRNFIPLKFVSWRSWTIIAFFAKYIVQKEKCRYTLGKVHFAQTRVEATQGSLCWIS